MSEKKRPLWTSALFAYVQGIIVALIVMILIGSFGEHIAFEIVGTVIAVLAMMGFGYSACWRRGFKDRNLVNYGHVTEDKLRGLKAGLIAAIPGAVITALLFVLVAIFPLTPSAPIDDTEPSETTTGATTAADSTTTAADSATDAEEQGSPPSPSDIMTIVFRVWHMPYSLIYQATDTSPPITVLTLLIFPLGCMAGYMLGYKDISLLERTIYKNKRQKTVKKQEFKIKINTPTVQQPVKKRKKRPRPTAGEKPE